MAKYDALRDHLIARRDDEISVIMGFGEIEALVGSLPQSAWTHRAWWANDSKVQAQAWRSAGWRVESVDQSTEQVVFARSLVGDALGNRRSIEASSNQGPGRTERRHRISAAELTNAPVAERQPRIRVFLCHASQDKQATRNLYELLTGAGYDVWFDERNLLPGQDWEYEIRAAVKRSDAVIAVISRHSVNKVGFIQRELRLVLDAADERPEGVIFLIPLRLDDTPVPARLAKWQWLDATGPAWLDRLVDALGTVESFASSDNPDSVPGSGDSPVAVDFLGLEFNPEVLSPGQTMQLSYRVRLLSERTLPVTLGASLLGRNGDEYFDALRDREVQLAPDTAVYRRHLQLPLAVPAGTYRLVGAVWWRRVGQRRLATLDRGFVVSVVP
ncbi:toll/interleukin-1 receptor domain-containing protein [Actinomadura montaniterrae]|uniref:Toll/interleukin-1 receptor domain-containing protein n=1 Tax=Actinomadura montaniterrae TaxID=1803903 RepID=A0A6L3VSJ0_9ACTN|nr:toll/interleukin-1 receptor domain-containing protein [Actinomadura montaniterrae]KAB2380119.1 toll/interleukin-1 receptor domain-containing protein [Actinomadura montaniterrae]